MASISPRPSSSHLVSQPTGLSRRSSSSSLVAEKVERQQTISAHMASSKRGGSGNVGKKRAQPEETPFVPSFSFNLALSRCFQLLMALVARGMIL
jgi:hypothetical protein